MFTLVAKSTSNICKVIAFGVFTSVVKGTGNVGGVFTLVAKSTSNVCKVIALMCSLLLSKLEHLCVELMRPVLQHDSFGVIRQPATL